MKLNPFDLAALDQEIRHELSRITRDVKSQARSSPGIRGRKRMAAWRQTLNARRQIGDAVPILGEVQRLFARPARFRFTWGPVGQHVTVRPFVDDLVHVTDFGKATLRWIGRLTPKICLCGLVPTFEPHATLQRCGNGRKRKGPNRPPKADLFPEPRRFPPKEHLTLLK